MDKPLATLKRWRYEGTGPEYVEIEGRVRYDVRVLLDYIKRNTRVPSVRAAMEETRGAALRKKNSKFYWYDFTVRGQRYRGSTKETNITRAGKIAALKLTQAIEGHDPLDRKAPTLLEFSSRFVEWVKTARLEFDTRRYYLNGWRLLQTTQLPNVRLDRITADVVEGVRFSGSPANGNNALRTLRRM